MYIITSAPADYDYHYMEEIGEIRMKVFPDTVYRILRTDDEHRATNYQLPRYHSGLYAAWVEHNMPLKGF